MYTAYTLISKYIVTIQIDSDEFESIENKMMRKKILFKIIQIEDFEGNIYKKIENYAVDKKYNMKIDIYGKKDIAKFFEFRKKHPEIYSTFTGFITQYYKNGQVYEEYFMNNGKINGIYKRYEENGVIDKEFNVIDSVLNGECKSHSCCGKYFYGIFDMGKLIDLNSHKKDELSEHLFHENYYERYLGNEKKRRQFQEKYDKICEQEFKTSLAYGKVNFDGVNRTYDLKPTESYIKHIINNKFNIYYNESEKTYSDIFKTEEYVTDDEI